MFRAPLPSTGSSQGEFSDFLGTTSASDFSLLFTRRFVAFASRYPSRVLSFVSFRLLCARTQLTQAAGLGAASPLLRSR
jgi:hypothetical protein